MKILHIRNLFLVRKQKADFIEEVQTKYSKWHRYNHHQIYKQMMLINHDQMTNYLCENRCQFHH